MEREGGNGERMKKCRESISLHFLILSPFPLHFLILSPFPLHFLILSPFSRSLAPRLQRVAQPWNKQTNKQVNIQTNRLIDCLVPKIWRKSELSIPGLQGAQFHSGPVEWRTNWLVIASCICMVGQILVKPFHSRQGDRVKSVHPTPSIQHICLSPFWHALLHFIKDLYCRCKLEQDIARSWGPPKLL